MKKFIQRNTIISVFGFISLFIAFSYAFTYNMPDYWGIESWFSFFNNLSISYIAALIFYVLQVYKPECENSRRAQTILEPLFLDLIKFMEVTISCCRKYVSLDENDIIVIDWWNKEQKIIYFVPVVSDSTGCSNQSAIRKSKSDLRGIDNTYKSKIREIKERIDFRECDSNILNALSKLESIDFFRSTVITALMFEGSFVRFSGFQESVNKFEQIKDEFKQSCGIDCKYDVRNAENEEIAICEAIFYKNALQTASVDEFNEMIYRESIKVQLKPLISDEAQLNIIIDNILEEIMSKKK